MALNEGGDMNLKLLSIMHSVHPNVPISLSRIDVWIAASDACRGRITEIMPYNERP